MEYKDLIKQIQPMDSSDLLYLYVVAKTGDESNIEVIPSYVLEAFEHLDRYIHALNAHAILKNVFDSDEET